MRADMTFRRRIYYALAAVVVLAGVVVAVKAPYLPRMVSEGFPAAEWPASGSFADIAGAGPPADLATGAKPVAFDPRGRSLFDNSEGKALLVYQGGRLRFEHYAAGYDAATRFNSYSVVKSLVGALVLKAHAEGRIASLDDPIGSYLGGFGDARFRAVPIVDFLTMRSGVIFEEDGVSGAFGEGEKDLEATWYNPLGPLALLHMRGLEAVADRLTSADGGRGRFNYQNVNTAVLGKLLETVYGRPLERLLDGKIWTPAGAAPARWRRYGVGRGISPYCCLYATARDWVRVGSFIVNNGSAGQPFLPPDLWRRFLGGDLSRADIKTGHYGLHLRHDVLDRPGESLQGPFSYMVGSGGQIVYLMPANDLVVVRFGTQIALLHSTLYSAWRTIRPDRNVVGATAK